MTTGETSNKDGTSTNSTGTQSSSSTFNSSSTVNGSTEHNTQQSHERSSTTSGDKTSTTQHGQHHGTAPPGHQGPWPPEPHNATTTPGGPLPPPPPNGEPAWSPPTGEPAWPPSKYNTPPTAGNPAGEAQVVAEGGQAIVNPLHPNIYNMKLDPNILHLRENMEKALNKPDYEEARHTLRTAVDVSIHGIKFNVLREYDYTLGRNRALVDELEPAHACIEALSKAAIAFIDCVSEEAVLNTNLYKNIEWEKRASILDIAAKNVKDEVCALESQLNDFVRDAIKDLNRLGHVGFGLQDTPPEDPRYVYYQQECNKAIDQYKLPVYCKAKTPEPEPEKVVFIQQPPPHVEEPIYALTTTTYHPPPIPVQRMVQRPVYRQAVVTPRIMRQQPPRQVFRRYGY